MNSFSDGTFSACRVLMPNRLYKSLVARVPKAGMQVGISADDIRKVEVTSELVQEIVEAMCSADSTDIIFGLYFFESLCGTPAFNGAITPVLSQCAELTRALLTHPDRSVRSAAVRLCACLRSAYPDYKELMTGLLEDAQSGLRWELLGVAHTFLERKDLGVLKALQDDPTMSEIGGMGGPQRYIIRDFALEVAEKIAGRRFYGEDRHEVVNGIPVSWRSWESFVRWLYGQLLIS